MSQHCRSPALPAPTTLDRERFPPRVATGAGVRYTDRWEHWQRNDEDRWQLLGTSWRVLFPTHGQDGTLIGIQGRAIEPEEYGNKAETRGTLGVVLTEGAALSAAQVVVTEAPIDALSLAAAGVQAIGLCGTNMPDWLPEQLAGSSVALALDNDGPGEKATTALSARLVAVGARVERLRPEVPRTGTKCSSSMVPTRCAPLLRMTRPRAHSAFTRSGLTRWATI
jgi:hypothetical protein